VIAVAAALDTAAAQQSNIVKINFPTPPIRSKNPLLNRRPAYEFFPGQI